MSPLRYSNWAMYSHRLCSGLLCTLLSLVGDRCKGMYQEWARPHCDDGPVEGRYLVLCLISKLLDEMSRPALDEPAPYLVNSQGQTKHVSTISKLQGQRAFLL